MPPKPEVVMIKRKLKKLKRQPAKATKKPVSKSGNTIDYSRMSKEAMDKKFELLLKKGKEERAKKGKKKQQSITLEQVKANLEKSATGKMFKAADELIKSRKEKVKAKPDGMTFASAKDKIYFVPLLSFPEKKDYSKTLKREVGTDYEKLPGFSSAKAEKYTKLESLFEDGLTGKQANQKERFDEMYDGGIRSLMEKRIKNAERAFKKENKGKKTLNEWEKLWDNFRVDINLDDYK